MREVQETVLSGAVVYENTDEFWANMTEVAAPVVSVLRGRDRTTIDAIKEAVFTQLQKQFGYGSMALPFSTLIIQGVK